MPRAERVAYGQKCSVSGIRYSVEEQMQQIRGAEAALVLEKHVIIFAIHAFFYGKIMQ